MARPGGGRLVLLSAAALVALAAPFPSRRGLAAFGGRGGARLLLLAGLLPLGLGLLALLGGGLALFRLRPLALLGHGLPLLGLLGAPRFGPRLLALLDHGLPLLGLLGAPGLGLRLLALLGHRLPPLGLLGAPRLGLRPLLLAADFAALLDASLLPRSLNLALFGAHPIPLPLDERLAAVGVGLGARIPDRVAAVAALVAHRLAPGPQRLGFQAVVTALHVGHLLAGHAVTPGLSRLFAPARLDLEALQLAVPVALAPLAPALIVARSPQP